MQRAKLHLIISMILYGTIGVFSRFIHIPSSALALSRSLIGSLFLLSVIAIRKNKIDFQAIKRNWKYLLPAGMLLGVNWAILFESYTLISITVATLCYYLAPVFVTLAGSILYRERLTPLKAICSAIAFIGIVFVTDIFHSNTNDFSIRGVGLAVIAAAMYATIVLCNKHIQNLPPYDMTATELVLSVFVMLPYVLLTTDWAEYTFTPISVAYILILGIVHTGIAYLLYFPSIPKLPTQTTAICSYIDPIVAILCSALILREPLGIYQMIGCIFILGSTFASEIFGCKKHI